MPIELVFMDRSSGIVNHGFVSAGNIVSDLIVFMEQHPFTLFPGINSCTRDRRRMKNDEENC